MLERIRVARILYYVNTRIYKFYKYSKLIEVPFFQIFLDGRATAHIKRRIISISAK